MGTWWVGLGGGVVVWTLLEYVLHRWAFHRRVLGRRVAREHIQHHAKVDYFSPVWRKLALAAMVLPLIMLAAGLVLGWELGSSVPTGVVVGWLAYEWIHRRIHVAAPVGGVGRLGAYGRWARRHHLHHHFGRADMNHGVSTPIWDLVFGTFVRPESVRIPRAHVAKFPWLLEASEGAPRIASDWAGEYRLV